MKSSANGKEKKQPDSFRGGERLESSFFLTNFSMASRTILIGPLVSHSSARLHPSVNHPPSPRLMAFGSPLRGNILLEAEIIAYFYGGRERPEGGNNGNRD